MTINPIVTDLINLINKICRLQEAGFNISHKECPTDLSWVWRDKDTDRVIATVKLSRIKAIMPLRKTDPRIMYLITFVIGTNVDPIIIRDSINKLEKLKAFW
jgi:hypothetical protein